MIKPEHNAAFVCRMEDGLDLYHEPYDPARPIVCFDESNEALHKHVRDPLPGAGRERSLGTTLPTNATARGISS